MSKLLHFLGIGRSGASAQVKSTEPYTGVFFEMDIVGNPRTGSQIEDWTSQASIEISKQFDKWDGRSPLNVSIPNDGKGEVVTFDELLDGDRLPKKLPPLGHFNLYRSSVVTDFVSGSFLSQYGMIVSGKVKQILEHFHLGDHRFYPLTLEHKENFYPEYFLFKTIAQSDPYIDIAASAFYLRRPVDEPGDRTPIRFPSEEELQRHLKTNDGKVYEDCRIVCGEVLQLKADFPKYDLFYTSRFNSESDSRYPILSERLRHALEGSTGVRFEKTERIRLSE